MQPMIKGCAAKTALKSILSHMGPVYRDGDWDPVLPVINRLTT